MNLTINKPVAVSDILRAAENINVLPRETPLTERYRLPTKDVRNIVLSEFKNVKKIELHLNALIVWVHQLSDEKEVHLPFWKDLDIFHSASLTFAYSEFYLTPKDEKEKCSMKMSYEPIIPFFPGYFLKDLYLRLAYVQPLYENKCLFTQGSVFDFMDRKDVPTYQIIEIPRVASNFVDKYLYYVYSSNVRDIQNDEYLLSFTEVSKYIVDTNPPAIEIVVNSANRETLINFLSTKYPEAQYKFRSQLKDVDEEETKKLHEKNMLEYWYAFNKILLSKDRIPPEIVNLDNSSDSLKII